MDKIKQIATVVGVIIAIATLASLAYNQLQGHFRSQIRDEQNQKTLELLVEADEKKLEYIQAIDNKLDSVKRELQSLKDAHPKVK